MLAERKFEVEADLDRAERVSLEREATLRDDGWRPFDVVVEDLSVSGCRIRCARPLGIGTLVSIGVSGAGMQMAKVTRVGDDGVGCAFVTPLTQAAVQSIAGGRPLAVVVPLDPAIRRSNAPAWSGEITDVAPEERWSPAARLLSIASGAALGWAVLGGIGYGILHAVA